jgi:hypothetical protein
MRSHASLLAAAVDGRHARPVDPRDAPFLDKTIEGGLDIRE